MFSRTYKLLWRLSAQTVGGVWNAISTAENTVYGQNQRSSYRSSMTHDLVASLVKANTSTEIFRSSKWSNSFISPLLGPPRDGVRAPFFWSAAFYAVMATLSYHFKDNQKRFDFMSKLNSLPKAIALTGFALFDDSTKTPNAIGVSYV